MCVLDVVVEDVVNVVGVDLNMVLLVLLLCIFGLFDSFVWVVVDYCDSIGWFDKCI